MSDLVTGELAGGIATITLNRPESGNALSWELTDTFSATVERLAGDEGVRAFLIRAEGKNFCVGGDIRSFAAEADPAGFIGRLAMRLHDGIAALAGHPAPVVTAVQGAAAGAGLSLAVGGDIAIVSEDANFTMAYTGIGITPDGGTTWLLPRLIGLRATQELAYLNRRLTAPEALELGLVTRVVPAERLAEEAAIVAGRIAAGPTAAFGGVKTLLAASGNATLEEQLDAEAHSIALYMAGRDAAEGVAAFLERRKPMFTGR